MKKYMFLNWILDFFWIFFVRWFVRMVVCNFRWGMVSCFRGVIFDFVVMNLMLYILLFFFWCMYVYVLNVFCDVLVKIYNVGVFWLLVVSKYFLKDMFFNFFIFWNREIYFCWIVGGKFLFYFILSCYSCCIFIFVLIMNVVVRLMGL